MSTHALVAHLPAPADTARAEMMMTSEQIDLVKRTVCKGATDDELRLFLHASKRLGLDPLAKQVHAVKRWDREAGREVMSIQVGIDGFRVVAERSGHYQGQTEPQWCGPDGEWRSVWLSPEPPAAARVGVHRADFKEPVYGVARWQSYAQFKKDGHPTAMWARMPDVMLSKCAEALALRKAFPADLSGVYTPDEMGQADSHAAPQRREQGDVIEGETVKALPAATWERNATEMECVFCNTTMPPQKGWVYGGEGIHRACWDARKKEREAQG